MSGRMDFGLMFFASSEDALQGSGYDLVIQSARFADENGFSSVWVPERHFTRFGCLYPNPAVLHAALARETRRVRLQAGSVVLPLHNPLRVAEEWSVVDNLSRGRVGISFASGWNPNDFAFFPDRYSNRHEEMFNGIETVRRLWRGESIPVRSGTGGTIDVRIYPTPVQKDLPVWVTAAGNPATFIRAGEIGAHLLTHLLDQDSARLAEKIALYRNARAKHGFDPAAGRVTIMLHTFVGDDLNQVREIVRNPYCEYLKENALPLLRELAFSRGRTMDSRALSSEDLDAFAGFLFERFFSTRALMGTPESCMPLISELRRGGVDEIACLLDFGPPAETIIKHLSHLHTLAEKARRQQSDTPLTTAVPAAVSAGHTAEDQEPDSLAAIRVRCVEEIEGTVFYQELSKRGIELQGSFRGITRLWRRDGESLAEIRPPAESHNGSNRIDPALLDSCFQALGGALPRNGSNSLYLPAGLRGFRILETLRGPLFSHARLAPSATRAGEMDGTVRILDDAGRLVAHASGLRLRPAVLNFADPSVDRALYRIEWESRTIQSCGSADIKGTWLLCTDRAGIGSRLEQLLSKHSAECVLVAPDTEDDSKSEVERVENLRRRIAQALRASDAAFRGVVHLGMLDVSTVDSATTAEVREGYCRGLGSALVLIQELAKRGSSAPVCFVTRGAQDVGGVTLEPLHQSLWSLARACAVELPEFYPRVMDLDPNSSADESADCIVRELRLNAAEDDIAYRNGERHVGRLAGVRLESSAPLNLRADATYLITGGTGGLGLEVAEWMARSGARNLALVSRTAPSKEVRDALIRIEQAGARAQTFQADVSSESDTQRVLAQIELSLPPLAGIVHAAGELNDALFIHQDWEHFARARGAKVDGAWNLHSFTRKWHLDFFVMFSSGSTWIPAEGQANYVAANAFLDGLAAYRRALGLHGLSIGWGPWARIGHAATSYGSQAHRRLAERGIQPLEPGFALQALERLLSQKLSHVGVLRIDWARLFHENPVVSRSSLLARYANEAARATPEAPVGHFVEQLERTAAAQRFDVLVEHVSERAARVMGLQSYARLEPDRGLFDLGMDSMTALELKTKLQESLGRPIPSTLVFDHPSVTRIAQYLLSEILHLSVPSDSPQQSSVSADKVAAIESMSDEETEAVLIEKLAGLKKRGIAGAGS